MKELIGYKKLKISEKGISGYTIYYTDDDVEVDNGKWCGSVFMSDNIIHEEPKIGAKFEFKFKSFTGPDGKISWKPSGVNFIDIT